jgi:hypothetical protein
MSQKTNKDVPKGCVGLEFEFFTDEIELPNFIKEKFNVVDEYYPYMYELNKFYCGVIFDDTLPQQLEEFFASCMEQVQYFKDYCKSQGIEININTQMIPLAKGFVFNGVHFHFSIHDDTSLFQRVQGRWKRSTLGIAYELISKLPSYRKQTSHHVWGRYAVEGTSWKRQDSEGRVQYRYKPIIRTGIPTIEVRIIDNEDIIEFDRRKILSNFLSEKILQSIKGVIFSSDENEKAKVIVPSNTDYPKLMFKENVKGLNILPNDSGVPSTAFIFDKYIGTRLQLDGASQITGYWSVRKTSYPKKVPTDFNIKRHLENMHIFLDNYSNVTYDHVEGCTREALVAQQVVSSSSLHRYIDYVSVTTHSVIKWAVANYSPILESMYRIGCTGSYVKNFLRDLYNTTNIHEVDIGRVPIEDINSALRHDGNFYNIEGVIKQYAIKYSVSLREVHRVLRSLGTEATPEAFKEYLEKSKEELQCVVTYLDV